MIYLKSHRFTYFRRNSAKLQMYCYGFSANLKRRLGKVRVNRLVQVGYVNKVRINKLLGSEIEEIKRRKQNGSITNNLRFNKCMG